VADQQRRTRVGSTWRLGQQSAGDPATGTRLREILLRLHGKQRDCPVAYYFYFYFHRIFA